jgi:esterase/lipase superfamily enzyme
VEADVETHTFQIEENYEGPVREESARPREEDERLARQGGPLWAPESEGAAAGEQEITGSRRYRVDHGQAPAGSCSGEDEAEDVNLLYRVWFATNRKRSWKPLAKERFTSDRDSVVHFGHCDIFVPKSHKIGSLGSSFLKRLLSGKDDRLKVKKTSELTEGVFWAEVRDSVLKIASDARQGVVYIHGYNASFTEAALRAGQLGCDLKIQGAMAFYSWPSRAKGGGYKHDEAAIEASEEQIANFLADFATRTGSERVHVIAHSMGNRGLLRAISRIVAEASLLSRTKFTNLILAAPDVDVHLFKDLARNFQKVSQRATLYVSDKDIMLEASSWLHDFQRAGWAPPITVIPGVDTVHVANIDVSLLGHSYIGAARDVLNDVYALVHYGAAPHSRMGLRALDVPGTGKYYTIGA